MYIIKIKVLTSDDTYLTVNKNQIIININLDYKYNVSQLIERLTKIKLPSMGNVCIDLIDYKDKFLFQVLLEILFANYAKKYSKKGNNNKQDIVIYFLGEINEDKNRQISLLNSVYWAKYIADLDSLDDGTPESICKLVKNHFIVDKKVKVNIIDEINLKKMNLNLLSSVGQGSINKPYLLELSFTNNPNSNETIALIGKGVTFDAGGYALKNSDSIRTMRLDKCGGASAIAIFDYLVKNNSILNIVVAVPLCENTITANSILPSQVIKSYSGKTVQIDNPDAEGRLILADTMSYIQSKYNIQTLITLATLTGSITITLGKYMAGLFSNDRKFAKNFMIHSNKVGDEVWELPIHWQNTRSILSSELGDITNAPIKKYGGSSQAAAFLQEFITNETKFIHLDIGGTGVSDNRATGSMVKGIINFLNNGKEGGYYDKKGK